MRLSILLFLSFLAPCGWAAGEGGSSAPPLTLAEAVRLALAAQPQFHAIEARAREARESATAAAQLPDPRLNLGLASLPLDSLSFVSESMTQAVVGVSQTIPGGDKRRLAGARQDRAAEEAEAALAAARRRVAREVGQAWLNLYLPSASLARVREIEQEYQRQIEWAEAVYPAGRVSLEDSLALRVMAEYVKDRAAELVQAEARARALLGRWLGATEAARPVSQAELPRGRQVPASAETLERHPELRVLQRALAARQAEVDLAREAYKPDWNLDVSYGLRGGNRTDLLSVQVGVDLPLFPAKRQDRRLAARLASVEEMSGDLEDLRVRLNAELAAARADWQAADTRLAQYETGLIPLAHARTESALAGYRTGKATYAMVLDGRRAELEAELKRIEQQVARARAAVDLAYYAPETCGAGSNPVVTCEEQP
jgi:outer membrane protein TolC